MDIYNLIAARRSGFRFFVAGFGYSRDFDRFSLPLSQLGGKSIIETMRELDANSANTLGWAAHMYPDWSGVFRTPDDLEAYLDSFYANILGDPIILTETNHNSGWTNWDNAGEQGKFYRSHFMFVQLAHWCRKRGVGYCYWPTTNYAAARLFDLEGDGEITLYSQSSLSAAMTIIAATDRAGQVFTGTQHGLLTPTVIPALLRNHPRDPEDDESTESYDPAPSYALGFGGAGYNVVTGDATSNNFLFGGEGRSVLYGGSYDDCLSLGAGGGVARTYGGNNHVWNYGDGADLRRAGLQPHHVLPRHIEDRPGPGRRTRDLWLRPSEGPDQFHGGLSRRGRT